MWKNIQINHDIYMISTVQKGDTTKIFLTNLVEIWMETLTNEIIVDRCQKLNPLLNVEALNYNKVISDILNDIPEHIVEASLEEIKLRAEVDGGFVKFALNLRKGTALDFWEIITKPLCISSMEIIRQREFLLNLVKEKDEEIAEYKAEGAELIRKNIETKTFTEAQLTVDNSTSSIVNCTNAFQEMAVFYNKYNLCKYNTNAMKSTSTSNASDRMEQIEQNTVIPMDDEHKNPHGNVSPEQISVRSKNESLNSIKDEQCKEATKKEAINKKSRSASMAYIHVKRPKKGGGQRCTNAVAITRRSDGGIPTQDSRKCVHRLRKRGGEAHKVRRYCSQCYKTNVQILGRDGARNLTKKVVTFCDTCKAQPYLCLECFNIIH